MRRLLRLASAGLAVGLAIVPVTVAEASPASERQWWFDSWNIEETVWPQTKGAGVTVAVIDTGVNARLPDMRDAVVPGKSFTDSGGDGRRDTDTYDGHGTLMASLIASRGSGTGFMGVAPKAKIMPLAAPGLGDATVLAIRYAVDHGAKIINLSQGAPATPAKPCPDEILGAVAYAAEKDVIVVASAGNEGDSTNQALYPASCPGVVAIGAMDNQGRPWKRTQRQDYVALGAPGVDIPALSQDGRVWPNGEGTSHAAALASGAFALLRAEYPKMSARQIVQLATNTAKDFGPKGKDNQFGYGVISLRTALRQEVPASAPNPVYERLDQALAAQGGKDGQPSASPAAAAAEEGSSNTGLFIGIAAVVIVLVLIIGAFVMVRSRRGRSQGPGSSLPPLGWGQGNAGAFPGAAPAPTGHQGTWPQPSPYGPPPQGQPGQTPGLFPGGAQGPPPGTRG